MSKIFGRPRIGLALGGGGVRGLAHIGVLEEIEREQIPVDLLTGSSMGGLIAALYASGLSIDKLKEEAINMAKMRNLMGLVNLTHPGQGVLNQSRIREFLKQTLGEGRTFADLEIPLALTAVDLFTGKEVHLCEGRVDDAVIATIAIPGLLPPIEINDLCLVDGGVLNNVPATLARKLGAQVVIAVDVSSSTNKVSADAFLNLPGPLKRVLPQFALELYRVEMIMVTEMTKQNLRQARPEFVIKPDLHPEVTVISGFHLAEDVIAAGAVAVQAEIPNIQKKVQAGIPGAWKRLSQQLTTNPVRLKT